MPGTPLQSLSALIRAGLDQFWLKGRLVRSCLARGKLAEARTKLERGLPFLALAVADPFTALVSSEVSYPGRRIALIVGGVGFLLGLLAYLASFFVGAGQDDEIRVSPGDRLPGIADGGEVIDFVPLHEQCAVGQEAFLRCGV